MEPAPSPGGTGFPRQLVVLGLVVVILIAAAILLLIRDDGDADVEATAPPEAATTDASTTSQEPTTASTATTLVFQAPPQQAPVTSGPTADTSSTTETTVATGPGSTTTAPAAPVTTTTTTAPSTTTSTTTTTQPLGTRRTARPGPSIQTSDGAHGPMTVAVVQARDRWRNEGPTRGYVFRTQRICFCPRTDNEISVDASGRVVGQKTIEGDAETDPPTIDEVFDLIEAAIRADADSITASFDRDTGFPVSVSIDYDERLADEEEGRQIDWWAPRQPPPPSTSTTTTTVPGP